MKRLLVFECPILSRSGYGSRSRDLIWSLKPYEEQFDIRIAPTSWGNTPDTALNEDTEKNRWFKSLIAPVEMQPDAYIKIGLPTEFRKIAKVNIGFTAGTETNAISHEWINALNDKCDVCVVSSEYVQQVFKNTTYDMHDRNKDKVGELKVKTPVEVLFEGYDEEIFTGKSRNLDSVNELLEDIPETFCFLFTGHWLQGDFGHDRKDVAGMIQSFYTAFKSSKKNKPALILKTGSTFTVRDQIDIQDKISNLRKRFIDEGVEQLPNIYIVWGELTDEEMNDLYNHDKVKVHVSFTKGEGFGRPLLEASTSGKLIFSTYCSGHKDFLENLIKIPTKLHPIHKSVVWENILIENSQWHYADYKKAIELFKDVYKNFHALKTQGMHQQRESKKFTLKKMGKEFVELLDKYVPKQEELMMPELIDLDELEELQ